MQAVLRRQSVRSPQLAVSEVAPVSSPDRDCYWGEQIDVSTFRGRENELQQLESWLVDNPDLNSLEPRCRLISIVGMGGMGKTSLAAKLTQKLAELATDRIVWQSLRNAPPLDKVLFQLIAFLSHQQQTKPADTVDAQISQLMAYLRTTRCPIVFDNFESIFSHGSYREGYAGYSELLRRIATEHHASCLILTSREKPRNLIHLEGESTAVCTLYLFGLSAIEVQAIGTTNGCQTAKSSDWQQFQQSYSGNPLAIKIATTTIRDLFDGSVSEFLIYRLSCRQAMPTHLYGNYHSRWIIIWDIQTGECVKIIRSLRPYEGMNIRGIQGLTAAQQENLTALGAIL